MSKIKTNKNQNKNKFLIFSLLFLVFSFGVAYVFQVNRLAVMGYEIKNQEKTMEDLKKDNDGLKLKVSQLKLVENLEKDRERIKLKKPEGMEF